MNELALAAIYRVMMIGGDTEVSHAYPVGHDMRRIRVDCETADTVIEVGWDTRGALDSVQQALFAQHLTGKRPAVLLIDTDGRIGPYEHRVRTAAAMAGVEFSTISKDFLIRWRMTSWLRAYRVESPVGS